MFDPGSVLQNHGRLSDREADSVRLLVHGHSASAIADEVGVTANTARMRLASARSKLGTPNLAALVAWGHTHRACCVSLPRYASSRETITELDGLIHELDSVFERVSHPAVLTDSDGRYVLWNSSFRQLVGVDDAEIASRRLGDFSPPRRRRAIRLAALNRFEGNRPELEGTMTFRHPDGQEIELRVQTRALSAGDRVNALLCVMTDPAATPNSTPPLGDHSPPWDDLTTDHATLTRREAEVVEMLAAGLSIGRTAECRGRSIETIRMHVRHAREKTRTRTLATLLAWWFRHAGCCRSGGSPDAARAPATLLDEVAQVLDGSDKPAALFDLDWRPMFWGAGFNTELGVTSSEIAATELNRLLDFDSQDHVQATMGNMHRLLLRDSRVRVNFNSRTGSSHSLEIDLGVVGKGGKPRAHMVMVQARR